MRTIITLTSDWGHTDHYTASVKGRLLSALPEAVVVDITHDVPRHNLMHAAFVLKSAFREFPAGSIHIVDILSEAGIDTPNKVVLYQGQYFIGTDNGIFSLICEEKPEKIIEIEIPQDSSCYTFLARDLFVKTAVHLAQGKSLNALGKERNDLFPMFTYRAHHDNRSITGNVIHVDSYENLFVNITEELFRNIGKGRPFSIRFRSSANELRKIRSTYSDVGESDLLALFSSGGYLQLAINRGNAAGLLGVSIGDQVKIEFEEKS